jgi:hypothetical protein
MLNFCMLVLLGLLLHLIVLWHNLLRIGPVIILCVRFNLFGNVGGLYFRIFKVTPCCGVIF